MRPSRTLTALLAVLLSTSAGAHELRRGAPEKSVKGADAIVLKTGAASKLLSYSGKERKAGPDLKRIQTGLKRYGTFGTGDAPSGSTMSVTTPGCAASIAARKLSRPAITD